MISNLHAQTGVEELERKLETATGAERVSVLNELAGRPDLWEDVDEVRIQ